ncbi:hypothetical protein TA3x_001138 [Tundrisphaera sp. TA3]|uniref:hypothetical protein n=1 Tax=Tundrisphaera sp. TA3 TaxID=3435775 RepID=UPI003EBC13C9
MRLVISLFPSRLLRFGIALCLGLGLAPSAQAQYPFGGGFAYGGYGYGYGVPGYGYGYVYPAYGYGVPWGFGSGVVATGYPVLGGPYGVSPLYGGVIPGAPGYGPSGVGFANPLFSMGLSPLAVQNAAAERALVRGSFSPARMAMPAPSAPAAAPAMPAPPAGTTLGFPPR